MDVQIFTPSMESTIFLPRTGGGVKAKSLAKDHIVQVKDQDGRLILGLSPGEEAAFKLEPPKWWQIWQCSPRWKRVDR